MHCDRCIAWAVIEVMLDTGLPLAFCLHHANEYDEALSPHVTHRVDLRHMLDA